MPGETAPLQPIPLGWIDVGNERPPRRDVDALKGQVEKLFDVVAKLEASRTYLRSQIKALEDRVALLEHKEKTHAPR